jgi:hypothetical protein
MRSRWVATGMSMKTELLSLRPASGKHEEHWFDAVDDCVSVLFEDDQHERWLGVFGSSGVAPSDLALAFEVGVAALVLASGQGYVVDVNTRSLLYRTNCDYLLDAVAVPRRDLVIACDCNRLCALSSAAELWESEDIAMEGFDLGAPAEDHLVGHAWDRQEWRRFKLTYDGWVVERLDQ